MRFEVLGALRVRRGGAEVAVPGTLRQRLLALLLANANTRVPAEWLAHSLWADKSVTPGNRLQLLVHRLRRSLDGPSRLVFDAGGYRLRVEPDELDSERFALLAERARERADPADRVAGLREALALWRGVPYEGIDVVELADEVQRLREHRLLVLEQLYAAELARGRHAEIAAELTEVVRANPLRERLCVLLMTALYAAGRQADALAVFRRAREVLVEELGIEPAPEVRELERRIAAGEPLDPLERLERLGPLDAVDPVEPEGPAEPVPAQLPHDVTDFVGREPELAELGRSMEAGGPSVVVVTGTAGVGKSTLVAHWVHRARERFPDGQLYVDLCGYAPEDPVRASDVLAGFLRSLGLAEADLPRDLAGRAARFRTMADNRRMVIVVDNAAGSDQVRPLLPGSPSCSVIVTSRDTLLGLTARDGAHRVELAPMSEAEARALVARRLGGDVAATVGADDVFAQLIKYCARLPLALRVAIERVRDRRGGGLAALVAELADEHTRLDVLDTGDALSSVRAVFSWSYRQLPEDAARLFRAFGLLCAHGDHLLDAYGAAALLGTSDLRASRRALRSLVRAHLVSEVADGRYGPHELLYAYAAELAGEFECPEEHVATRARLFGYYLHTSADAVRSWRPRRHRPYDRTSAAPTRHGDGWSSSSSTSCARRSSPWRRGSRRR